MCGVMTGWRYAHYNHHVCGCQITMPVYVSVACFFCILNVQHYAPTLSWSYITHHLSPGLWPTFLHAIRRKTSAASGGENSCVGSLFLWQDLVALGSFCANNILDQSSFVIGQRGFKQREKKKLLSQAKISRAAGFDRFSEEVTFAVVSRAFGGGWWWLRSHLAPDYWVPLAKSLGWLFSCSCFPKMRCNCILGLLMGLAEIWIIRSTYILGCKWFIISNTQFIRYSWEPYRGELQLDWSFLMNPSTMVSVTEHTHVKSFICVLVSHLRRGMRIPQLFLNTCLFDTSTRMATHLGQKPLQLIPHYMCVCVWVCV